LALHPNLAIRHAGGQLFQEAHFDLVRAPPPDLFGFVESATLERVTRGGTHFTPPALARSIVDYTLAQLEDIEGRAALVLSDPACGSAAFLHEALRGLRRANFDGAIKIVGRDISDSAISMARFTLKLALKDWTPKGGAELDLCSADSMAEPEFPQADVTVMNPPFISVIAQTPEQKAQLRKSVGDKAGSRGDYSMAFVTRALESLNDGGVMGSLFPANLLTHEAAMPWRENLTSLGEVRLLASIGDFGLFSQALVHVACVVLTKGGAVQDQFTALVTGNEPGATGDALRELRKTHGAPPVRAINDSKWNLFSTDSSVLGRKLPWRILTPKQRGIIDALEAAQTPTVDDLFGISQGVQTGNLKSFVFSEDEYHKLKLPLKERQYFRDALMTDSIQNGKIVKKYYMFFPHGENGPLFEDEAALMETVPHFYRYVLKPNESILKRRASIVRSKRDDWWGLMHPRTGSFALSDEPRIVSKFFGAAGSFVLDAACQYLPSTGHVWTAKKHLEMPEEHIDDWREEVSQAASLDILRAYVTLLNSQAFIRLVSFRSVTIAGGQFDLSSRFLAPVHLPDLWEKVGSLIYTEQIKILANATEQRGVHSSAKIDSIVAYLYGVPELGNG
jgi:adenine-specific DNA-methyltransferase